MLPWQRQRRRPGGRNHLRTSERPPPLSPAAGAFRVVRPQGLEPCSRYRADAGWRDNPQNHAHLGTCSPTSLHDEARRMWAKCGQELSRALTSAIGTLDCQPAKTMNELWELLLGVPPRYEGVEALVVADGREAERLPDPLLLHAAGLRVGLFEREDEAIAWSQHDVEPLKSHRQSAADALPGLRARRPVQPSGAANLVQLVARAAEASAGRPCRVAWQVADKVSNRWVGDASLERHRPNLAAACRWCRSILTS